MPNYKAFCFLSKHFLRQPKILLGKEAEDPTGNSQTIDEDTVTIEAQRLITQVRHWVKFFLGIRQRGLDKSTCHQA